MGTMDTDVKMASGLHGQNVPSAPLPIPDPHFPSLLPAFQSPELEQPPPGEAPTYKCRFLASLPVVPQTLEHSADLRTPDGFADIKS